MFSQVYGIDTVSLRYFNVYGENMAMEGAYKLAISIFANQHKQGLPLTITNDGNQRRDFTYVDDWLSTMDAAGKSNGRTSAG